MANGIKNEPVVKKFSIGPATLKRLYWLLLIIYFITLVIGILNHEQWRDEAEDWMTVRDINIVDLFNWWIPQGGHPPIWYIILLPLGKAGLPFITINWTCLVIMTVSMYLMLFRTHFPLVLKICTLFSYYFLYEYGVIARNYCVIILFAFCILSLYPRRFDRPWLYALSLVGLFNTHIMVFVFSGSLVLLYAYEVYQYRRVEWKKYLGPLLLVAAGSIYIIPYLILPGIGARSNLMVIPDHFAQFSSVVNNAFLTGANATLSLLLFLVLVILLAGRPKAMFVFAVGGGALLYILSYRFKGHMRHDAILLVIMLCCYGIAQNYSYRNVEDKKGGVLNIDRRIFAGQILLALILFYQMGFGAIKTELEYNFSGGKDAATFIMENNLDKKILVGHMSWAAGSVLAQLPPGIQMYYPDCDRTGTFVIYDSLFLSRMFALNGDYGAYRALQKFQDGKLQDVVLVMNMPITDPSLQQYWKLVYRTVDEPLHKDEIFFIYEYSGVPLLQKLPTYDPASVQQKQ
jgi:hypothetical protein